MTVTTFYVYVHRRTTDGKIFYVGKGSGNRAYQLGRNPHWHNIVHKHGYTVHFVDRDIDEATAFELEMALIDFCGRNTLCNITDGGDGCSGLVHSAESRAAMSRARKGVLRGPLSAAHKAAISRATKGVPLSDKRKAALSAQKGVTRRPYGPMSAAQKAALSRAQKGVPRGPMSAAHKAAMSRAKKDVPQGPLSDSHKAALSRAQKGVPLSAAHKTAIKASWAFRRDQPKEIFMNPNHLIA